MPSAVVRELNDDPDQFILTCAGLLGYAETYHTYEATKDKTKLESSKQMNLVIETVVRLHHNRTHPQNVNAGFSSNDWGYCKGCELRAELEARGEEYE
jgi:hypothetical protein